MGDDSITKMALALLVVLFVIFAALGFYFMSNVGNRDKPDTLVAKMAVQEQAIRQVKGQIKELDKAVEEKKEQVEQVDWDIEVEDDQKERLRVARRGYQTYVRIRQEWVSAIENARSKISEELENGQFGYQNLVRRKNEQERDNARVVARLDTSIDESRNERTKANNRYTRRYEDKRNERSRLKTGLDQAKAELQKASQREPADLLVEVDGVVLATDLPSRQVVINMGENQGVKRGMRFEIFRIGQGGRVTRKGFVDVRVLERETATCIILERDIRLGRCPSCGYTAQFPEEQFCTYCTGSGQGLDVQRLSASPKLGKLEMNPDDPMVKGDHVRNPLFNPDKTLHFAVKGEELSPRFKNQALLNAVRWHGGVIDSEVGAGTDVLLAGRWAREDSRKARELGIRVLHQYHVFDFLRKRGERAMAERSSGLVAGLITVIVMTAGALAFMFATMIQMDESEQALAAMKTRRADFDKKRSEREQKLAEMSTELTQKTAQRDEAARRREDLKGWRDEDQRKAEAERARIQPAIRDLMNTITDGSNRIRSVDDAIRQDLSSFENTRRSKQEELDQANKRLMDTIAEHEEKEKNIDTDIGLIRARLDEVQTRLHKVQAEALRRKTISDSGGEVIAVGDPATNFVVINLGTADRIRKGQKFEIWSLKRGYGLGWVEVRGRNFVKEGYLPGDLVVVGQGGDALRFPIVSVGVSKEAEKKGTGLARERGYDTIKIAGAGVNAAFSVEGQDWSIERNTSPLTPEEVGAVVKGMIEVAEVRTHSSDAYILPERHRNPICTQCSWEATKDDMRYCPFCVLGDKENEVQQLDQAVKGLLNKAEDAFKPIATGDRLSNPYFSATRPLVFVLGSEPVRRNRQDMKAFIEENGGRVLDPEVLRRPEDATVVSAPDVAPSEVNFLIPGSGPDADDLLKRARELGIRIMREQEIFEFFGEPM